ncbi:hypothetical protein LTR04_005143 [Oleoguttula sp. CCFEE 6159]|nr:hypothetical protein LTR04_005143 [Oleoguttula sp. CCFEE 6159]
MSRAVGQGDGSVNRNMSHGRGGAGNFGKPRPDAIPHADELITPTIKSSTYTTGRGGTGNMAKNDPDFPEMARASQDVVGTVQREPEGNFHYGRGGAANVAQPSDEEARLAREKNTERRKSIVDGKSGGKILDVGNVGNVGKKEEPKGLAQKGKNMFENMIRRGSDAKK